MDSMLSFACLLSANSPWHPCSPFRDFYELTFSFSSCRSLARFCREDIWPWSSDRSLIMLSIAGMPSWEPGCVPVVPLWALGVPVCIPGVVLWVPGVCPSLSMSEVWGLAGVGWPAASWRFPWRGTAVRTQEHPQLSMRRSQRDPGWAVAAKYWLIFTFFPSQHPFSLFSGLFTSKCLRNPLAEAGSDLYYQADLLAEVGAS